MCKPSAALAPAQDGIHLWNFNYVTTHYKYQANVTDPNIVMADPNTVGMVDPHIFEDLQTKIDEDAQVRERIRSILQILERQDRGTQSVLSRAHSTPLSYRN
jgi:hypothetical protein